MGPVRRRKIIRAPTDYNSIAEEEETYKNPLSGSEELKLVKWVFLLEDGLRYAWRKDKRVFEQKMIDLVVGLLNKTPF